MSSPGQKRGTCGHVMALFDSHKKCGICREKGVGERNLIARSVRASPLLKFNNWPPRPTNPGKNVESRRRRQKLPVVLPPFSWTLQTLLCWDGYTQTSHLLLNLPQRRRGVLIALLNPARGSTAVNPLLRTSKVWMTSGVRGFHDLKLCFLVSRLLCR